MIDEPTNHLDMGGAREQVMQQYLKRKKGFILVSHDRHFLTDVCDHILAINPKNIEITRGNFSTWQSEKEKRDVSQQAENEKLKRISDAWRGSQTDGRLVRCGGADKDRQQKI